MRVTHDEKETRMIEQVILALAALNAGIASGAIHELAGKRWSIAWSLFMAALLVALAVL